MNISHLSLQSSFVLAVQDAKTPAESFLRALAILFGILLVIQFVAYWIASKLLAGEKGTVGRAVITWVVHTGIAGVALVLMAFLFPGLNEESETIPPAVWGIGIGVLVVMAFAAARIHDFGLFRGFGYLLVSWIASVGLTWLAAALFAAGILGTVKGGYTKKKAQEEERTEQRAQTPPPNLLTTVKFATRQEAETAAQQKYPTLSIAGSPFNKAFVDKYKRSQTERPALLNDPSWPMILADEVAKELNPR